MVSNNSGIRAGHLAGMYEGRIGWLISPGGWRQPPEFINFALDNGAFNGFDETAFFSLLNTAKASLKTPLFVTVPDCLADREETISRWNTYVDEVSTYKWPLAFVLQDGMTEVDIPANVDWLFIGGSTEWKWRNLRRWKATGKKIHVGRVNTYRLLWMAHDAGADSCDGTGWFRGCKEQLAGLYQYLHESTHGRTQQRLMA